MKRVYIIILFATFLSLSAFSQKEKKYVREGNDLYKEGNFPEAEVQYRKALATDPKSYKGKFNLGDAMHEQKNFTESAQLFNELTESGISESDKSSAYYNLGNSFLSDKKYKESIEAFKNSLRTNPEDQDAKYNLEYARKMLQQQQQQQNQDKKDDQDKKDQNKDQQDKKNDQNKDKEQKDDQQKQDQNKGDQKNNQQKQQQQPQQISKEDAKRMMEALKNDEKKTLQKLQEQKAKAARSGKSDIDW